MDLLFCFLGGVFCGMIINYIADVLPNKRRLMLPVCLSCDKRYAILNYLFIPRRCTNCHSSRAVRTWVVEFGMGLFGVYWLEYHTIQLGLLIGFITVSYLALVSVIDIEHRLIMHLTSVFGFWIGLITGITLHGWQATLLGGLAGYILMLGFYSLGFLFIKISHQIRRQETYEEEAIGFGDVNLAGIIGLMLGWPGITVGMIITIFSAGAISLIYLLIALFKGKYHPDLSIPYGPFLNLSAFLLLFIRPYFNQI